MIPTLLTFWGYAAGGTVAVVGASVSDTKPMTGWKRTQVFRCLIGVALANLVTRGGDMRWPTM